jgi:hypothetical protein
MEDGSMTAVLFGGCVVVGLGLYFVAKAVAQSFAVDAPPAALPPAEPKDPAALWEYRFGPINPAMVCPHCQTRGRVHARRVKVDAGISGEKAAAAVITGGISVLVTGLSSAGECTEAACENCLSVWQF